MSCRAAAAVSPRVARQIMLDSGARVTDGLCQSPLATCRHNHCTGCGRDAARLRWSCRRTCKCALRAHHHGFGRGPSEGGAKSGASLGRRGESGPQGGRCAFRQHARDERRFAALRRLGIPDKSIQTSDFSITPQYQADRNGSTSAKIVGYQTSNEVRVAVDDLTIWGPLSMPSSLQGPTRSAALSSRSAIRSRYWPKPAPTR